MSKAFNDLPEEKRMRIINAAMKVFSQNSYKAASTDDIAAIAGISKGSLFYYFHNKKSLYLFLYEYTGEMMKSEILDVKYWNITDFFELMTYASKKKLAILHKNPYLTDFAVRCFYTKDEPVSDDLENISEENLKNAYRTYFQNVDFSKFKDHVNPEKIYHMLIWMTDGYMHEKRREQKPVIADDLVKEFKEWSDLMKCIAYKEEYIHEKDD